MEAWDFSCDQTRLPQHLGSAWFSDRKKIAPAPITASSVCRRMTEYGTELAGQASFDPEEVVACVAHMVLEAGKAVAE